INNVQTCSSKTCVQLRPTFQPTCLDVDASFELSQTFCAYLERQFPPHSFLGSGELLPGSPPRKGPRLFPCFHGPGEPARFSIASDCVWRTCAAAPGT